MNPEAPDPRYYSILPPGEKESLTSSRSADGKSLITEIDHNGERRKFHVPIERNTIERLRSGEDQMLLTRLVGGIISVSPVVFFDKKFHSYEVPLDEVPDTEEDQLEQPGLDVDKYLLGKIFHDTDHFVGNNYRIAQNGAYTFYDFEDFSKYFWEKTNDSQSYDILDHSKNSERTNLLLSRIEALLRQLDGDFIIKVVESIIRESGKTPSVITKSPGIRRNSKIKSFQTEIVKRLESLKQKVLSLK